MDNLIQIFRITQPTTDAVLARYMVDGDKDFMLDMTKDLETEYQRWERTNSSSVLHHCHDTMYG